MQVTIILPGGAVITHDELEIEERSDGIRITVPMQTMCEALSTFFGNTAEVMQAMKDGLIDD